MQKNDYVSISKILGYSALFLCLGNARIAGVISPFMISFAFALVLNKEKSIFVCFPFTFAFLILNPTMQGLIILINVISVIVFIYLFHAITKKQETFLECAILLVVSLCAFTLFNIESKTQIIQSVLSICLSLVFLYVCNTLIHAIKKRGISASYTLDEYVCISFFIMAVVLGLSDIVVFGVKLSHMFVLFVILLLSFIKQTNRALYFAGIAGIGLALKDSSIAPLAVFCVWAIGINAFGSGSKLFSVFIVMAFDLLLGTYFNGYPVYTLANFFTVAIPSFIFLCLPQKTTAGLKDIFLSSGASMCKAYLVNKNRSSIAGRLKKTAGVFYMMADTYQNLTTGELNRGQVKEVLTENLISSLCSTCERRTFCYRENEYNFNMAISEFFDIGLEKKAVNFIDVPKLLSEKCYKINTLISTVNESLFQFFQYEKMLKTEDGGKMLVASHLKGTAKIFDNLSRNFNMGRTENIKKEKDCIDELLYADIICREAIVLEDQNGLFAIILTVKTGDLDINKITNTLTNVFRCKLEVVAKESAPQAGWTTIELKAGDKFKIVIGSSSIKRESSEKNGDVHTYVNLDDNRYLITVCDGMGSGTGAQRASETAVSLIENFYRAGFDSDTVLNSVNKLLSSGTNDMFSALDIAIVDISTGDLDFIKIGSPVSIIKRENESELVTGENLPIGIVEKFKSTTYKRHLFAGDVVVLTSDGIADAFNSEEEYLHFVNNEKLINMQMLAESICEEAVLRSGNQVKDDMTVVAFRVMLKV